MSFTTGFEKTAFVLPALQKARGFATKAVGGLSAGVKSFASRQREKGIAAYRSAMQPSGMASTNAAKAVRKAPGEALYNKRIEKATNAGKRPGSLGEHEAMAAGAKQDVASRAKRMENYKRSQNKSFASKHPYITAGGLYLGTKAMMGGGDKDQPQQQQPQYQGPQ